MHADSDYAYRDTQPDNADLIGRKENQRSSKIQHFAWRGPQNVLFNERDVTDQSRFFTTYEHPLLFHFILSRES